MTFEQGRADVRDYYSSAGEQFLEIVDRGICAGPDAVRATVRAYSELGADEIIFNPALDDINEVEQLASVIF